MEFRNFVCDLYMFYLLVLGTTLRENPRLANGYLVECFRAPHDDIFLSENLETTKLHLNHNIK